MKQNTPFRSLATALTTPCASVRIFVRTLLPTVALVAALLATTLTSCSPKTSVPPLAEVIDLALQNAEKQALLMAERYAPQQGRLPRTWEAGEDVSSDSRWWCSGFFPGTLWYLYENSGDPALLDHARLFTDRVEREKHTTSNHDVGFMLMSSFGNALRFDPDPQLRERYEEVLSTGARSLATRFRPSVGLIRSWDHNRERWQYPVIIDNMMNLELMIWASDAARASADGALSDRLRRIAFSHADSTMVNHFRADMGTWHVVSYDTLSGRIERRETHQGHADSSTWSRGEAWALYGYTMMHRVTGEDRYLRRAQEIAAFMIRHPNMPPDYIPYWDFDAPDIPDALRDASAAAIMASALVDLAARSAPELAREYMRVAQTQVRTLASPAYTAPVGGNGNFILMHAVGGLPLDSEVDVPLTYADYYYVEALTRLKKEL